MHFLHSIGYFLQSHPVIAGACLLLGVALYVYYRKKKSPKRKPTTGKNTSSGMPPNPDDCDPSTSPKPSLLLRSANSVLFNAQRPKQSLFNVRKYTPEENRAMYENFIRTEKLDICDGFANLLGQGKTPWLDMLTIEYFLILLERENKTKNVAYVSERYLSAANIAPAIGKKLKNAQILLCAIECKDHFFLLIVQDKGAGDFTITALDGLHWTHHHAALFEEVKAFLVKIGKTVKKVVTETVIVPKQNNFSDCGVVACLFAEKYCQEGNLRSEDFSHIKEYNYTPYRGHIYERIRPLYKEIFQQRHFPNMQTLSEKQRCSL